MNRIAAFVFSAALLSASAFAAPPAQEQLVGSWVEAHPTACGMAFHVKGDGTLVRKTGELEYITRIEFVPEGRGWLLRESLQSHNDRPSCRGEAAESVVEHLKQASYVELQAGQLKYYRVKGQKASLRFIRETQPGA